MRLFFFPFFASIGLDRLYCIAYSRSMNKPQPQAGKRAAVHLDASLHAVIKKQCPKGYKLQAFIQELLINGLTAYRQNLRIKGRSR